MHRYNRHRPHASISGKPPISRLGLSEDNLLRLHTFCIFSASSTDPSRIDLM
jgi:hypothetical protein